jgi:predicted ATPase
MSSSQNNWYVLTGGPATGKTTLLHALAETGFHTIHEAARQHIDDSYKNGILVEELRADEKRFQEEVARIKLNYETSLDPAKTIFFDRGMHDTVAYMNYYNYPLDTWLQEMIDASTYKKVFILEPLDVHKRDYARIEDEKFMGQINDLLFKAYSNAGMKPIVVPADTLDQRLKFIIKHI